MNTHLDISNLPVNPKKCKTCPFSNTRDRTLEAKVIERCMAQQTSQICHGTEGPHREPRSLCRGMRDLQLQIFFKMGYLSEATDEAWEGAREQS